MSPIRCKSPGSILFTLFLLLALVSCEAGSPIKGKIEKDDPPPLRFAVYYGQTPHPGWLSRYQWAIVQDTVHPPFSGNTVYFAYLSIGEVDRDGAVSEAINSIPGGINSVALAKNRFWHSTVVDIRKEPVRQAMLDRIERDVRAGFGGVFLDTLDSAIFFSEEHPKRGKGLRRAIVSLVASIHASYPQLRIVINRGFALLPELSSRISGVLYEDFCSRYDDRERKYVAVPDSERKGFLPIIHQAQSINPSLVVLALDYDDPTQPLFLPRCQALAKSLGFAHFDSNLALDSTGPEIQGR